MRLNLLSTTIFLVTAILCFGQKNIPLKIFHKHFDPSFDTIKIAYGQTTKISWGEIVPTNDPSSTATFLQRPYVQGDYVIKISELGT